MSKNLKKILILTIFFFVSLFIGYENPNLVETPKKYIKYFLKKINFLESFVVQKEEIITTNKQKYEKIDENIDSIEGNSFNLFLKKEINFDDRTAGFFINDLNKKLKFDVFLQNGLLIKDSFTKEIYLPADISFEKNGGVKSVFEIDNKKFILTSNKKSDCNYAAISEIEAQKIYLKTKCLPDTDNVDFNGLGGAFIEKEDYIYLTIGAPEWNSEKIRNLSQKKDYLYGKIIRFKKQLDIIDQSNLIKPQIFTSGHKNPQGLTSIKDKIFSIEHGPQGGDEINLIMKDKNYGWPIVSYGTEYNNGNGFKKYLKNYEKPKFIFLPSIAPSALNICPRNLQNYYKDDICLMFLSLKGMSLYIALVDRSGLNVISLEKFDIGKRLRHFGIKNNKLFEKDNSFFVSADDDGIYRLKFSDFR